MDNIQTPEKVEGASLRPICFMIMPYGKRATCSDKEPTEVDYDALWDKALLPLIEEDLGYLAIRADQDMGAMIIKEMIERLTFADLVIADVSIPNANVYYEIGVRHTAKETGCVLICADWSKQSFDIDQMRQIRYTIAEGQITNATASTIREELKEAVLGMVNGISPVYQCIPGYPSNVDKRRLTTLRSQVEKLSQFSTEIRMIRNMKKDQRASTTKKLIKDYGRVARVMPAISLEIINLLTDNAEWETLIEFIDNLPNPLGNLPKVREKHCLARSKTGDHGMAIAALEELIDRYGETSERRGLIGGRYKKLFYSNKDPIYLDRAIDAYERGMILDLNGLFPISNLARLYRIRNGPGDEEKAKRAITVALLSCERTRILDSSNGWLLPTQLGAAFDAGNVDEAEQVYTEMCAKGVQPYHLDTLIPDLEISLFLQKDTEVNRRLKQLVDKVKSLK